MTLDREEDTAMAVDVIIPTWNRSELLSACLASLAAQDHPHNTIVVDNASDDGSAEMVAARFADANVIRLSRNEGFARAVNCGIRAGRAAVVVVINNDVVLEAGFLRELVAPLAQATKVGSVAGVLVQPDGDRVDAAGVSIDMTLAGYSFLRGVRVADLDRLDDQQLEELVGPCGGAAAYRRTALADVGGGFDDEIFAYSEDVDLAMRMRTAGWGCVLAPRARAVHVGSATLGRRTVAQTARASWARGYILGRYRVALPALVLELLLAAADAVLLRSALPITARHSGWRRGRALPPRPRPRVPIIGLVVALRLRARGSRADPPPG